MACEQRLRAAQRTQLLPNVVSTEQQSLIVVKKLLAIAVSSITYLRGLFPEKAYGRKYVEEQKVMILREERTCPGASQIVQWMQGCFDALQRKYLRTVVMSIYTDPENPKKVTECYQFKVQYTEKGPKIDFESKNLGKMACSNTKKSSILLVRKLYTLMQNLGPLPDNVCLNMKLSYYDDVTPQDYHPPGFMEGDGDSMQFEKEPVNLTMGEVVTPFHTLKVDVTTERERLEQVDDEQPICVRDQWELKMEEGGTVTKISGQQTCMVKVMENPDNDIYLDNSEVQVNCQEKMEVCEKSTENSQMDTLGKRTSDLEMVIKRTRSGRVTRSTLERKAETEVHSVSKKKPCPIKDKMQISQFEFPCSQDVQASVPKKRKFSEPKERY
ncbi:HORMA domain-containing protein 1 isoform X4 [Salmo salar]|nr:HORMA domain-containing protein 1-like isoform X4 [Salmo salar]XP_045574405.1 HORMA domain-containing protein 1-like isoform X4 [Salmo salar]|eukprot:XP_014056301.1 PREDICTED: HORMA domain-containing protein 1-like isoform X2 [Salmo salar]